MHTPRLGVRKRIHIIGWRATRWTLPTAMMLLAGLAVLLNIEVLLGIALCLNLPALPGAFAAAIAADLGATGWAIAALAAIGGWLSWHGEPKAPLTLNLLVSEKPEAQPPTPSPQPRC